MSYKWRNQIFKRFDQAAKNWLEIWSQRTGGCPTMADNLASINAVTMQEWKNQAIKDIEGFHCGWCGSFLKTKHIAVIKSLLEEIKQS